jgi:phage host-nuclease inhibitor protein Gam
LKKDIAQKQEIHDTKQIRDLRREMKKLEDDLNDERN